MKQASRFLLLFFLGLASVGFARNLVRERASVEKIGELPWLREMDAVDFLGTTALGGLRPLFIDLLWMRAADAFTRKDWYDALPVSELICRLQPNLPMVWDYASWNMAYNISASKKEAGRMDEAWSWVKKGIGFLGKGIGKNPDSPYLWMRLAEMTYGKGTTEDYAPRFESEGIDPLEGAIFASREAAKRNDWSHHSHHMLGLYLRKKIEKIETSGDDSEKKLLSPLAEEAVAAYRTVLDRCPKSKNSEALLEDVAGWISSLERHLGPAKVLPSQEPKQSGGV